MISLRIELVKRFLKEAQRFIVGGICKCQNLSARSADTGGHKWGSSNCVAVRDVVKLYHSLLHAPDLTISPTQGFVSAN